MFRNDNMEITLTTPENQKNNKNENETIIDLGNCVSLIKDYYNIDNKKLFIKKISTYQEGMKIPKIEFDLYSKLNGKNLTKLKKSPCLDTKIDLISSIMMALHSSLSTNSSKLSGEYFSCL